MSIIAKATPRSVPVSEGAHIAICISVIDLGLQTVQWQGTIKELRKVMLTWEIPDETIQVDGEERPRVISKEYTLSLGDKAKLREHLEAWRGKKFSDDELDGFDLQNILGKPCLLQVLHNERGYANISAVMSVPKGTSVTPTGTELTYFDLTDPGWVATELHLGAICVSIIWILIITITISKIYCFFPKNCMLNIIFAYPHLAARTRSF